MTTKAVGHTRRAPSPTSPRSKDWINGIDGRLAAAQADALSNRVDTFGAWSSYSQETGIDRVVYNIRTYRNGVPRLRSRFEGGGKMVKISVKKVEAPKATSKISAVVLCG
jgi:hypothetical protein